MLGLLLTLIIAAAFVVADQIINPKEG